MTNGPAQYDRLRIDDKEAVSCQTETWGRKRPDASPQQDRTKAHEAIWWIPPSPIVDRQRQPAPAPCADGLTHVDLIWLERKQERWVRFGTAAHQRTIDHSRRILSYRPGDRFALVRWTANDFGTTTSRIDVVQAVESGHPFQTLPCVRPGGEILLSVAGWPQVERVLRAVDAIERIGIQPEAVSPDHWRHVHNRLTALQEPRSYTIAHHHAFLLRRRASS